MAEPLRERTPRADVNPALAPTLPDRVTITAADYRENFGEELQNVLDIDSWLSGDLRREYSRIEREVREAVHQEKAMQGRIRARIFPLLNNPAIAPRGGGVFRANLDLLARIHAGLLFNGGVEACDGTVLVHDTLPLTIYQVGVSLVFATQFPQHLPGELFSLCNNRILLRLGDEPTLARLRQSVGGVPEGLWARLKHLPTGQAIVSAQGIDPALIVALEPGRCKLRLVD